MLRLKIERLATIYSASGQLWIPKKPILAMMRELTMVLQKNNLVNEISKFFEIIFFSFLPSPLKK